MSAHDVLTENDIEVVAQEFSMNESVFSLNAQTQI